MRILLDTHAIIWAITDDKRLSSRAKEMISTAEEAYWSPLSLWEIAIKISTKKESFGLSADWHSLIPTYLSENQFTRIDITAQHCAELAKLPFHHRDPFDRMLITTAQCEDLTIISRDQSFEHYDVKTLW